MGEPAAAGPPRGAGVARLLPQGARYKDPTERPIEEREERDEPLRTDCEMTGPAVV